ncbi:MAG: S9 family peptidase [Bacteroidia bacterium]|nr:S9 family peptidase [Bacteroidia bacterium]
MKKLILTTFSLLIFTALKPQGDKLITLEDIYKSPAFYGQGFYGMDFTADGKHYLEVDNSEPGNKKVVRYHLASGTAINTVVQEKELLINGKKPLIYFESFQFSPDEKKILFYGEQETVYRHSTLENYYIFDLVSRQLKALSVSGKQSLAGFSPSGSHVAYVRGNNLYLVETATGKETRVTADGEKNKIINGAPDWVYEEEYSFIKAYWWSPDGKYLAYLRFDESEVREYNMQKWGSLYPSDYRFKYPKAGEKNSVVTAHVFDLTSGKIRTVETGAEQDQYLPRISWSTLPGQLCITRLNRLQNHLELLLADCSSTEEKISSRVLYTESAQTYIEIHDFLKFRKDGSFLWVSDKDGWTHIYLMDKEGKQVRDLTPGKFDVLDVYGEDAGGNIYYCAAEAHPTEKEVYAVKNDGSGKRTLSLKKGASMALFSPGFLYYALSHSDANTPPHAELYNSKGKLMRSLVTNDELISKMKGYKLGKKEFINVPTADGTMLNAYIIKPKDFDPGKKYPVFMYVYGGPGNSIALNQWTGSEYFYQQMLVQKGYIIACVDNRGTGNRGRDFKHCTYKQLGKIETQDQIDAAKYFGGLPYVDKSRIGIFGWSYGGYMTSLCITKGAEYFKLAIAVAPVTNWRYYDSIYTERYNGLPQDNASGYDDNSPINHADKLKGKYLLIHGTGDDNVHFQNAVEMTNALIKAGKQFETMYYPDRAHGIRGGNATYHLYTLMSDFVLANL